jgi:hypothetical protein
MDVAGRIGHEVILGGSHVLGGCIASWDDAMHGTPPSCDHGGVTLLRTARRALKRGGLLAAANWPIIFIQASADALFKLVVAVPFVGGVVLVALIVGAEPVALLGLGWRELATTIPALLLARPLALASFAAAMAIAVVGGSVFIFLLKGGTVSLLVRAEREAAPVEEPPLQPERIATAAVFTIERFIDGCRDLFPRFVRLGCLLMVVYAISGVALLAVTFGGVDGLLITAAASFVFAIWITVVNLVYLLAQIVMAAEGCGVGTACRRALGFVRRMPRAVVGVCVVTVGLIIFATFASLVATTALGLIGFVPFVGLAVLPLQLLAWLLRALVLQYISLASVGAYSTLYRGHSESAPEAGAVAVRPMGAEAG